MSPASSRRPTTSRCPLRDWTASCGRTGRSAGGGHGRRGDRRGYTGGDEHAAAPSRDQGAPGARVRRPAGAAGAMINKELIYVIQQIGNEKGIGTEVLFEALESALLSASKKTMGAADNVRMHLNRQTGALQVFARKRVVEEVSDPTLEISVAEARALNSDARLEDELELELPHKEFRRIAAQTAKQVILQRGRDAERDAIYAEFIDKEGKIARGVVHRIEKRNVIVELGKTEGVIPEREQIPGERYNPGDRVRAYVLEVKKTAKGPQIMLSRTHPGLLARLFEAEIPEIAEGIVQGRAAARGPGGRAEGGVAATKRDVDP